MSAIASIVINDGKTTPVSHTFLPLASDPEALYRENLSTVPLVGQGVIRLVPIGKPNADLQKARLEIELPALEVATAANAQGYTAAPKKAYATKVTADFFLPSRATAEQKKDIRVMLINLLANAQVIDLIENGARPY